MFLRSVAAFCFIWSFFICKESHGSESRKITAALQDLHFRQDGIYYVPCPDVVAKVSALHYENGIYVVEVPNGIGDVFGVWWCYNCQHYNSRFDAACAYCGKPRSG